MAISKILYIGSPNRKNSGKQYLANAIDYITDQKKTNDLNTGSSNHLDESIKYIENDDKTMLGSLVSSVNCRPTTAFQKMQKTKKLYNKEDGRQAYHLIISFRKGEVDKNTAFEIIEKFVDQYFKNAYEVVYSVHMDREHMHGHIVFNSVRCSDLDYVPGMKDWEWKAGYKFRYEKGDWEKEIQPLVDKLCIEHGIKPLDREEEKQKKLAWNKIIKADIDRIINISSTFDEFLYNMRKEGYTINLKNKYITVKKSGMTRNRRIKSLGEDYSEEAIKRRIKIKTIPLPELELDPEPLFKIKKVKSVRTYKKYKKWKDMNSYEKDCLSRNYRLGFIRRNKRYYRNNYADVKAMQETKAEFKIITSFNISNEESVYAAIEKFKADRKELYKKLYDLKSLERDYDKYFEIIKEVEALIEKINYGKIYEINTSNLEEKLESIKIQLKSENKSIVQIQEFNEKLKKAKKEVRKKIYEINKNIKTCERINEKYIAKDSKEKNITQEEKNQKISSNYLK